FRGTAGCLWTRRRTLPPVRAPAHRNARRRRPHDRAMRALPSVALLRAPTSDEQLAAMRAHVHDSARDCPGVYRMIAGDGEVVYVGKSKRIRGRVPRSISASVSEAQGARAA